MKQLAFDIKTLVEQFWQGNFFVIAHLTEKTSIFTFLGYVKNMVILKSGHFDENSIKSHYFCFNNVFRALKYISTRFFC